MLVFTSTFYEQCLHAILDNAVETIRVDYELVKVGNKGDKSDGKVVADIVNEPDIQHQSLPSRLKLNFQSSSINNFKLSSLYKQFLKPLQASEYDSIDEITAKLEQFN